MYIWTIPETTGHGGQHRRNILSPKEYICSKVQPKLNLRKKKHFLVGNAHPRTGLLALCVIASFGHIRKASCGATLCFQWPPAVKSYALRGKFIDQERILWKGCPSPEHLCRIGMVYTRGKLGLFNAFGKITSKYLDLLKYFHDKLWPVEMQSGTISSKTCSGDFKITLQFNESFHLITHSFELSLFRTVW